MKLQILLIVFVLTGCLRFKEKVETVNSSKPKSSKTKTLNGDLTKQDLEENFAQLFGNQQLDLRGRVEFTISGEYSDHQLDSTNITIYGDGQKILRSSPARLYKTDQSFLLGLGNVHEFFVVKESYNGESISTTYSNNGAAISYSLQL